MTPVFGSYLVAINYRTMGKGKEEKDAMNWCYISSAVMLSVLLSMSVFGPEKGFIIGLILYVANFVAWNFRSARKQNKYIVSIHGKNYQRLPWGKVLVVGILLNLVWQMVIGTAF